MINKVLPEITFERDTSRGREKTDDRDSLFVREYKYKHLWARAIKNIRKNRILNENSSKFKEITIRSYSIDQIEQISSNICFLYPNNKLLVALKACAMILVIYMSTGEIFLYAYYDISYRSDLLTIGAITDIILIIDFFTNFFIAYYNKHNFLTTATKKMIKHGLLNSFIINLVTSIPFTILSIYKKNNYDLCRFIKILRFFPLLNYFRALRTSKLMYGLHHMRKFYEYVNHNELLKRFLILALEVLIIIHISSCYLMIIARQEEPSYGSWIISKNLQDSSVSMQYVSCLYWAVTTLTTVGYGDMTPMTKWERLLGMVWMILGIYIVSFSSAFLGLLYSKLDEDEEDYHRRISTTEKIVNTMKIDKELAYKIKMCLSKRRLDNGSKGDIQLIFKYTPVELRYKIAMNVFNKALEKFPFFMVKSKCFIADVGLRLKLVEAEKDDVVWNANEPAGSIYFIISGKVIFRDHKVMFNAFNQGCYFGDIEVISNRQRLFNAWCTEDSRMFSMDSSTVELIKKEYFEQYEEMKKCSITRLKNMIQCLAEIKTYNKLVKENSSCKEFKDRILIYHTKLYNKYFVEEEEKKYNNLIRDIKKTTTKIKKVRKLMEIMKSNELFD